jgi:hypothetical protein
VLRESFRVDGGGGDHHLEVRAPGEQALEVPHEEVDVEASLVRLVEDDGVVGAQFGIALRFREENSVRHQLDARAFPHLVGEAHLVADERSQLDLQLLGDPRRHRSRGDAARLRVADLLFFSSPHLEQDLGELRGFSGARLAADDRDLVLRLPRRRSPCRLSLTGSAGSYWIGGRIWRPRI